MGAATAACQIEGGVWRAGCLFWDMFCRQSGRVYEGHTGHEACDHFGHWKEDSEIMKEIGHQEGTHAPEDSAAWYSETIRSNGANLPELEIPASARLE